MIACFLLSFRTLLFLRVFPLYPLLSLFSHFNIISTQYLPLSISFSCNIISVQYSLLSIFSPSDIIFVYYRITHKGCDFSDDLKLLKSSNFKSKPDLFLLYYPRRHLLIRSQAQIQSVDVYKAFNLLK